MSDSQNEGANYFASMTDLLVGVLFVLIIMVAYLAFQINSESVPWSIYEPVKEERDELKSEVVSLKARIEELLKELLKAKQKNPLEEYMANGQATRDRIVDDTVKELQARNIDAKIGRSNNVITISGANLFASGHSTLTGASSLPGAMDRVNTLAEVLEQKIDCHAISGRKSNEEIKACNPDLLFFEAIFIEGHTDSARVRGRLPDGSRNNLELSARRATNTYEQLVVNSPRLVDFRNPDDEQALSVAAYGEQRPVTNNDTRSGREKNRRIDIRFDMYTPTSQEALQRFREKFE
jgi:chemotaxis protein MotB